jgi:hypothetical protein
VASLEAGAPTAETAEIALLLCQLANSDDAVARGAFDDALAELLRTGSAEAVRAAHRELSGLARVALENLAGKDQLS